MAKIKQKSKTETKKKSTKAATVKSRTTTSPKKKTVGRVKVKTIAELKTSRKTTGSAKIANTKVAKSTVKKTTAVRTSTVKKPVSRAKAAPQTKRTVSRPTVVRAIPAKSSAASVQPLERKQVSMEELRMMLLDRRSGILKSFNEEIAATLENESKQVVVGDAADLAQGASENELSFRLAEVESRELGQIDKALAKINEGTYGVCEKCNEPISSARMKALPFASKCIRCQEEDEQEKY